MKLYYSPGACSLAPHIIAREAGIDLQLDKVDTKAKRTASGHDYLQITPKGYVPALELADGQVLTEGPAIQQFLADLAPESGLAPPNGSFERVRLQEMLGYINSELHKSYSPLFSPDTPEQTRAERKAYLRKRYEPVERVLAGQPWIVGDRFGIADAYLFVVTNWAKAVELDLSAFPALLAFQNRVAERPAVQAALVAEGLVKAAKAA